MVKSSSWHRKRRDPRFESEWKQICKEHNTIYYDNAKRIVVKKNGTLKILFLAMRLSLKC